MRGEKGIIIGRNENAAVRCGGPRYIDGWIQIISAGQYSDLAGRMLAWFPVVPSYCSTFWVCVRRLELSRVLDLINNEKMSLLHDGLLDYIHTERKRLPGSPYLEYKVASNFGRRLVRIWTRS